VIQTGNNERAPFYFGRLNAFRALNTNRTLNGDGLLTPGILSVNEGINAPGGVINDFEPKRFILSVKNVLSNARNVSITLTPIDNKIVALQPTVTLGSLASQQQREVEFTVQLQNAALDSAGKFQPTEFLVTYRADGGYINYERLTLVYRVPAQALSASLLVTPSVNFGTTPIPTTATVRIANNGNQSVRITGATFTGANGSEFALSSPLVGSEVIVPGGSVTRQIIFTPAPNGNPETLTGLRTATLTVNAVSEGVVSGTAIPTPVANGYTFSQRVEPYSEITSTDSPFARLGANLDDGEADVPLPFPFRFGQKTYTTARLVTNGFLAFNPQRSSILDGDQFVFDPISDPTYNVDGLIAGFGFDLYTLPDGQITYETRGTAPNRTFIVQWKRASIVAQTGPAPDGNMNFQIRLYETSNRIEFAYDRMDFLRDGQFISGQVGLRGATITDFNSRRVDALENTTWLTSVPATFVDDQVDVFPSVAPPSGLVFTYTPGDFAATNAVPRVTTFQRTTQLTAQVRTGGVPLVRPTSLAGLNFSNVTLGTTRTLAVTVANINARNPLVINSLSIVQAVDGTSGEFVVQTPVPITIAPNGSQTIQVAFSPSVQRYREAALRIGYASSDTTLASVIPLYGTGQSPRFLLRFFNDRGADLTGVPGHFSRFDRVPPFTDNPADAPQILLNVGSQRVIQQLSLRNLGTFPITVTAATFTQATNANAFSTEFSLLTRLPFTVQPASSQTLTLLYAPTVASEKLVDITMLSNEADPAVLRAGSLGGLPKAIQVTLRTAMNIIDDYPQGFRFNVNFIATNTSGTVRVPLRNSSSATLRITSIEFSGLNAQDFSVDNAERLPIILSSGSTDALTVRFRPGAPGARTAFLTVNYDQFPFRETVEIYGSGAATKRLIVPIGGVPFSTRAPGTTSGTVFINLQSSGLDTIRVSSITIEGRDAAEFVLLRGVPAGTLITPTRSSSATLYFAPTSLGNKQALLVIRSDAEFPVMTVDLRALAADSLAAATLVTNDITAAFGSTVEVPVILRNPRRLLPGTTLYANLRVNATLLQPLDSVSAGQVYDGQRVIPLTLTVPANPNDSVLARLRFRTVLGTDTTSALRLEGVFATGASLSTVSGRLFLTGAPQGSLVSTNATASALAAVYAARPGETVTVPVVLRNRQNIPAGDTLLVILSFNATLLQPLNLNEIAGNGVSVSSLVNTSTGIRTLTFRALSSTDAANLVLPLRFRATVGNDGQTTIFVSSALARTGLQLTQPSGSFTLTNLNQSGGPQRFYSPKATLALASITPNPATDDVALTFTTSDNADITMVVADASGAVLIERELGNYTAGEYTVRTRFTGALPSGSYLLTLRSATGKATQALRVVR
jgi:hypothetical protein